MTSTDPTTDVRVILATDCGSTMTKAILIQLVDGVYRQTHRGEAPTTVEDERARGVAACPPLVQRVGGSAE